MALQVWLPLNGDLHNQGLAQFNPTINTAPTYTNNGKIGKALVTGAITIPAAATQKILNNSAFSFTCWIYVAAAAGSTTDRAMLFGNGGMGANNNRKFSIFQYPSCNDLHLSWQNDAENVVFAGGVWNGVFPSGKWTHLAITYQNPNGKIYINGIQYATFSGTSNSSSFAYNTMLFSNCPNNGRYLNDYRIYDHCLSAKEVEEISKGLILHYPLNDNGMGNTNLVKGKYQCVSTKDNFSSSGNLTFTLTAAELLVHKGETLTLSYDVYSMGDKTSNGSGFSGAGDRFGIHGSIKYTLNGGSSTQQYPLANLLNTGKNGHYSTSWTIPSNLASIENNLNFAIQTNPSNGFAKPASTNNTTWYLKNVKVEFGDKATPWSPNPADSNLPTNIIYDFSGYNHNGEIINSVLIESNSPKYNANTYVSATNQKIKISGLITSGFGNSYSFSWWGKASTFTSGAMMWGFADGIRLNGFHAGTLWNTGDSGNNPLYQPDTTTQVTAPTGNIWHHFVMTGDGTTCKAYMDGQLWGQAKTYKSISGTTIYLNGWDSGTSYCFSDLSISDFRIYATALTPVQIKELYETSKIVNGTTVKARDLEVSA